MTSAGSNKSQYLQYTIHKVQFNLICLFRYIISPLSTAQVNVRNESNKIVQSKSSQYLERVMISRLYRRNYIYHQSPLSSTLHYNFESIDNDYCNYNGITNNTFHIIDLFLSLSTTTQ